MTTTASKKEGDVAVAQGFAGLSVQVTDSRDDVLGPEWLRSPSRKSSAQAQSRDEDLWARGPLDPGRIRFNRQQMLELFKPSLEAPSTVEAKAFYAADECLKPVASTPFTVTDRINPPSGRGRGRTRGTFRGERRGGGRFRDRDEMGAPPGLEPSWVYIDQYQEQRGPFTNTQMAEWCNAGFFKPVPDLPLKKVGQEKFVPLSAWYKDELSPFDQEIATRRLMEKVAAARGEAEGDRYADEDDDEEDEVGSRQSSAPVSATASPAVHAKLAATASPAMHSKLAATGAPDSAKPSPLVVAIKPNTSSLIDPTANVASPTALSQAVFSPTAAGKRAPVAPANNPDPIVKPVPRSEEARTPPPVGAGSVSPAMSAQQQQQAAAAAAAAQQQIRAMQGQQAMRMGGFPPGPGGAGGISPHMGAPGTMGLGLGGPGMGMPMGMGGFPPGPGMGGMPMGMGLGGMPPAGGMMPPFPFLPPGNMTQEQQMRAQQFHQMQFAQMQAHEREHSLFLQRQQQEQRAREEEQARIKAQREAAWGPAPAPAVSTGEIRAPAAPAPIAPAPAQAPEWADPTVRAANAAALAVREKAALEERTQKERELREQQESARQQELNRKAGTTWAGAKKAAAQVEEDEEEDDDEPAPAPAPVPVKAAPSAKQAKKEKTQSFKEAEALDRAEAARQAAQEASKAKAAPAPAKEAAPEASWNVSAGGNKKVPLSQIQRTQEAEERKQRAAQAAADAERLEQEEAGHRSSWGQPVARAEAPPKRSLLDIQQEQERLERERAVQREQQIRAQPASNMPALGTAWGGGAPVRVNTAASLRELMDMEEKNPITVNPTAGPTAPVTVTAAPRKVAPVAEPVSSVWGAKPAAKPAPAPAPAAKPAPAPVVKQAPAAKAAPPAKKAAASANSFNSLKDDEDMFWDMPAPKTTAKEEKKGKKAAEAPTAAATSSNDPQPASILPNNALTQWCAKELYKITRSEDLTLIEMVWPCAAPGEATDFITEFLGNTSDVREFAAEYCRRKFGESAVAKGPLMGAGRGKAAPAAKGAAAAQGGSGGGGGKKKGKGQKMDPNMLGFESGARNDDDVPK